MALRHTVYAEFDKLFLFSLSEEGCKSLGKITEAYVLATLERGFRTLDFYRQLQSPLDFTTQVFEEKKGEDPPSAGEKAEERE